MSLCRMQVTYAFSVAWSEEAVSGPARWREPEGHSKGTDVLFGYDFYQPGREDGWEGQWFEVWHTRKAFQSWWRSKKSDWTYMGWAYWDEVSYTFECGKRFMGQPGIRLRKRWAREARNHRRSRL